MTEEFDARVTALLEAPGLHSHPDLCPLLVRFANEQAGWYQSPVYLVGSALLKDSPRDIDVRVSLPDKDWVNRYGGLAADWVHQGVTGDWTEVRWRWSEDCVRVTRRGWAITCLNIDFQIYPTSYSKTFYDKPRLRLDTMPGDGMLPK